jgi:serine-type D-Ala-D-Ala carboxypeptidase (penicillin-binding protein 5/6)
MRMLAPVAALAVLPSVVLTGPLPAPVEPVGGIPLGVLGEPVVDAGPGVPELPDVEAGGWLVADMDGGVLAALNAHQAFLPASTIKLLTALVLLPGLNDGLVYTASEDAARVEGSRVGLVPDETYSTADLEHGLLLASGNDAAHALAEIAGGLPVAIDQMNAEALRLGAFDTRALTPHGLDEPGQVSSVYDLALIGRAVLANERLAELVGTRVYDFPGLDGETFQIQNHNRMLGRYDGAIGLKTGYTTEAGHTLVAAAERDGVRLIVTVLQSEGRAEPVAEALLDWAFAASGAAEPVGTLVTPDEAAALLEAATVAETAASPAPAVSGDDPAGESGNGNAATEVAGAAPAWSWVVAVLAAGAVLAVLRVRSRRPSRSP